MFMLFFIGILEMAIVTIWTKAVTKTKILASGAITMINVLIWFYVLQTIVNDISNWKLALFYAFGCAIGTSASTLVYSLVEKKKFGKALKKLRLIKMPAKQADKTTAFVKANE